MLPSSLELLEMDFSEFDKCKATETVRKEGRQPPHPYKLPMFTV